MSARVGVVGCGIIADVYVKGSSAFDSFDVVACADLDAKSAEAFADVHGLRASTVDELIADPSIDVVLNLTPPAAHAAVMRAAIEAGKHVYTEKPITTTVAEGRELLAEADRRGLRIGCAPDTFLGIAYEHGARADRTGRDRHAAHCDGDVPRRRARRLAPERRRLLPGRWRADARHRAVLPHRDRVAPRAVQRCARSCVDADARAALRRRPARGRELHGRRPDARGCGAPARERRARDRDRQLRGVRPVRQRARRPRFRRSRWSCPTPTASAARSASGTATASGSPSSTGRSARRRRAGSGSTRCSLRSARSGLIAPPVRSGCTCSRPRSRRCGRPRKVGRSRSARWKRLQPR